MLRVIASLALLSPVLASADSGWSALAELEGRVRVGDRTTAEPLARLVETAQGDVRAAAAFLLATVRAEAGDGPGARAAFGQARRARAVAEPAWRFLEVEVLLAEKKPAEAFARLRSLRRRFPKYRWAAADLLYSRLSEQVEPPARVLDIALDLYQKSFIRLPSDELLDRAARAADRANPERASRLRRQLILAHPESPLAGQALKAAGGLDSLSLSDRLDRVDKLFSRRAYETCRAEALALWERGYEPAKVGYYLGKIGSERLRDDYEGAERYLRAASVEGGPFALQALSSHGIVLMKLGRTDEAVARFDEWLRRHADAPVDRIVEAHYDRGRALHKGGRSRQAARDLQQFLTVHRKGFDWGKYQWFVGFWHLRAGDHAEALRAMKPLLRRRNPLVGGKARYWSAVAHDALGRRDRATDMLAALVRDMPLTWYSALAENRLREWGAEHRLPPRPALPRPPATVDPFGDLPDHPAVHDLRLAVHLGDAHAARHGWDRSRRVLRKVLGRDGLASLQSRLIEAVEDWAGPRLDAWRRHRRDLDRYPTAATVDRWRAIYPRAYGRHVEHAARRHGVPPWLVYAHMLQESRFKPWMISGAPAYGLMELLDRTARRLAAEAGEDYQLWMAMEPAHNIRWGTQYLGALYRKFHGQLPFAIASYNGGPMLVEHHLSRSSGLPFDVLIDDIGPHETRNYTRRVIEHFLRYLALYEEPERAAELRPVLVPRTWHDRALPQPDY